MSKLETLLSIVDKAQRQNALVKYAKEVGVDTIQAKDASGKYSEEKLAILIYDGLTTKKKTRTSNFSFVWIAVIVCVFLFGLIGLMPKLIVSMYKESETSEMSDGKVLQGYDEEGRPIKEDGEPVLYRPMEGVYHDYYDDGKKRYRYEYAGGELKRKVEYDRSGKIIADRKY